jgi:hypothetical protein
LRADNTWNHKELELDVISGGNLHHYQKHCRPIFTLPISSLWRRPHLCLHRTRFQSSAALT